MGSESTAGEERPADQEGRPYEDVSFWLEDVGDLKPRPSLQGAHEADVAILGAGYTGLWTAYYLLQREPGLRIAIVDSEIAGYGASGRNGGWCNASMMGISPGEMANRYGADATRATFTALREAVSEVGSVCATEGLDVAWRQAGVLRMAVGEHEVPMMEERWDTLQRLGLDEGCKLLDAGELAGRVRVADARGAVFDQHVAFHHPARLVRGLADVVEGRGAALFERSRVTDYELGRNPVVRTQGGELRADKVVFAAEAFLTKLREWRRSMIPVYSLIVLTEPLSDEQWDEIGWADGECLSSHALTVDYVSRTHDGRVLFGGRGAPYHFGSTIKGKYDHDAGTHESLRQRLRLWFPSLKNVRFTHAWGGPLGVTRDWMPNLILDQERGFATSHGYAGQGVAPSNLAGRTLADALTERRDSPLMELPLFGHEARSWEPEPFRWIGIRLVQRGLAVVDRRAEATGRAPSGKTIAERLSSH